ncbi:MAG: type IV pilus assembly protein PilM [bacterium]
MKEVIAYSDMQYLLHSESNSPSMQQNVTFDIGDKYSEDEELRAEENHDIDFVDAESIESEFDLDTAAGQAMHIQAESSGQTASLKAPLKSDIDREGGERDFEKKVASRKSRFLHSPNIIGIDYGENSLKYIILRKSAKGYIIEDYGCENLDTIHNASQTQSNKEEKKHLTLKEVFAGKIRKDDLVVSSISGLEVIYRLLSVPRMSKSELANAIPWALRADLPFGIETARVDFQIVGHEKESNRETLNIATLSSPKGIVDQHLKLFGKADFMPVKVTGVAAALWNVILQQKAYSTKRILAIEVGANACHLIFTNHGILEFHREITTAGKDIIDAISDVNFLLSDSDSTGENNPYEILSSYVIPDNNNIEQPENGKKLNAMDLDVLQVLDRLVGDVVRSIDYYKEKFFVQEIDTVLLSGGGALINGLDTYLRKALKLPVKILNPLQCDALRKARHERALEEIAPRMAIALGLALEKPTGLNLLPENMKKAFQAKRVKKFIGYFSFVLFVCLALATVYYNLMHIIYSEDLRFLETKYRLLTPQREEYLALSRRLDALQFKQQAYLKQVHAITSPEAHLRAISNLVPKSIALTSLTIALPQANANDKEQEHREQVFDYEEIILQGSVFPDRALEGANLSSFLLKLQTSGYFQDVEITGKELKANGTIDFVVKCYY